MGWGYSYYDKPKKKPIAPGTGIRGGGKYGTTWWGQQWLNAFNNISDSNRLPRGKTYAGNGSVRSISLNKNFISAKVQGSSTYEIAIQIPLFSEKDQAEIAKIVAARPDLLARLLNRELPTEVEAACTDGGIHIFPRSWRDLKAGCSCPDYAMPCKHLAAIIYLIAAEIDKNPFVVFDLHGFDLVAALQKAGFAASKTQANIVPIAADGWAPFDGEAEPTGFSADREAAGRMDFSKIPELANSLGSLLSENTVFYPKADFKSFLKKGWTAMARAASKPPIQFLPEPKVLPKKRPTAAPLKPKKTAKTAIETDPEPASVFDYSRAKDVFLTTDETGNLLLFSAFDGQGGTLFEADSMEKMLTWLDDLPAGRLDAMADGLRGLWFAWRFSEACARRGAMVPQLQLLPSKAVAVRWVPALLDENVRANFSFLKKTMPPDLLAISCEEGEFQPKPDGAAAAVCSVFFQFYLKQGEVLDWKSTDQPILQLFFNNRPQVFEKWENRETPAAIALYLNRFFLSEKNIVPVLAVEEDEDGLLMVNILADDKTRPNDAPAQLSKVLADKKWADGRLDLLRDLAILGEYFPDLNKLVAGKGAKPLRFEVGEFADILFKTLPVVGLLGIRVLLPKALAKIIRPAASLRLSKSPGAVLSSSPVSLKNLLNYDWEIALCDQHMSEIEFQKLMAQYSGLVKIRDEYVFFDEKEMKKLADQLAKPPGLTGHDLLQIALAEEYEGQVVHLSAELKSLIADLRAAGEIALPDGILANLRPYQKRGFSWLVKNARLGFGSILADDMGLGKTLQVISALLQLKKDGILDEKNRALAIVPTTLLTNWQKEVAKFAPGLTTAVFHGAARDRAKLPAADLVLTSYGTARSDEAIFEKEKWAALIIDEAQAIKNPNAAQTKAVKKLAAPVPIRIAMSGTPVENRLSEYWSLFDFANRGYLHGLDRFKKEFAIPIEAERDQQALRRFRKVTEPFVMRRLKTDKSIISDLPDKVERDQFCTLSPEQAALYENQVEVVMKKIESSEGIQRRGLVLTLIMALKQICNHPSHFLKRKKAEAEASGKCPLLLELLEQAAENDEKTIIFTQFQEMGDLLAPMISEKMGFAAPFLHGGTTRKRRDEMVEAFQNDPAERVLLLSLKAGGTGLNLTGASQVVHFDLWWNPAVEAQATDRAFRIGQKKNVQVHRFITQATFEGKINTLLLKKKDLADMTVGSGEAWIGDLSDKDLRAVFRRG